MSMYWLPSPESWVQYWDLTKSKQQNLSSEVSKCSGRRKFADYYEPEVLSSRLQSPPLVLSLSLITTVHIHTPHFSRSILISFPTDSSLPIGMFHIFSPEFNICAVLSSPIRATDPTHLTFYDLVILIIFGRCTNKIWRTYNLCA
jgi:hypothetical protein